MKSRDELPYLLNRHRLCGTGAEIGVFTGSFALHILKHWCGDRLILIDPWQDLDSYRDSWHAPQITWERRLRLTKSRIRPHRDRVTILRRTSAEAAETIKADSLDFVYIDANHAYAHAKADLRLWSARVKPGGVVAGHDYFNALPDKDMNPRHKVPLGMPPEELTSYGVKAAVDEYARERDLQLHVTTADEWPTWYFINP